MRPPRFRLRTLIIAVAVVTLILEGGILVRRSEGYRRLAAFHAQMEQRQGKAVRWIEALTRAARDSTDASRVRVDAASEARIGRHHAALKAKYLRAASRPWESFPPDPPEPERLSIFPLPN